VRPELHPDAAKNFDEKAQVLLAAVAPESRQEPSEPPTDIFRPGGHVVASFDEGDYSEFKITGQSDRLGRTTARYFEHEGRRLGFEDEKYQALARLSESVQKTSAFRDLVSTKWVEDRILDWIRAKFAGEAVPTLGDYLTEKCEADVQEHELWFPVSRLSVESDLTFGNVVFKTITEEIMDRMVEDMQGAKEGQDATHAAKLDAYLTRQRADLQGLAAATAKVTAEPQRAYEVALRESERAVAALRVYQAAATTTPEVTSYCALLGTENLESIKNLEMERGRVRRTSERPVDKPVLHWHLSDDDVRKYTETFGFDHVNKLLASKNRTRFQETLLGALLLYSRSTREKDLAGKLVYTLVALESVLLRNATEPIQQNVGERMAFINTNTVEKRHEIIRNLKAAYVLRSKFIHHGHTIEERETVWRFMISAWALFTSLAKVSQRFETKEELIDHLEAMKLS
jgi:hypothetical protein